MEHTRDRLAVLAAVSHEFARVATDYESLLAKIARTTADLIGDGGLVTLLDGDLLLPVANAHIDPAIENDYRRYVSSLALSRLTSSTIAAQVIRSGELRLVPEVDPESFIAGLDPLIAPLVRRMDVRSFCVVPIRAHGTTLGTLSLFRTGPGRSYDDADAMLLTDLADRAGLAIDNARLYGQLEQRVADRTRDLEIANRELEAFSYSVAHDLRSPLRTIDGFVHALVDDHGAALDTDAQRMLGRIRAAANHMALLIDGLLGLAQVSRAKLARTDVSLSQIAEAQIERLRERDPDRAITVDIMPAMIAYADHQLVEVILGNLLDNAWKFTSKRDGARIEITREGPAFVVRDNGAGFDPAFTHKLFAPFQRLHLASEFPGTGIGLGTVARAVQRHGGRIWATGVVDGGAAFHFTLEPGVRPRAKTAV